jgi:hypothetical protein
MKYLNFLTLILAFGLFLSSPSLSMEEEPVGSSHVSSVPSFEDQLMSVTLFAFNQQSKNKSVKMILGCTNQDKRDFFNEDWVFLDIAEHDPKGRPYIKANFNDVPTLRGMASMLSGVFEKIVLDDSTYKATVWNPFHLKHLASLLKDDGEFIFVPEIMVSEVVRKISADENEILKDLKDLNQFSDVRLPTSLREPIVTTSSEEIRKIKGQFKREVFIPHVKKVVMPFFKEIEIQEDAPYPIPTNEKDRKDNTVFICKGPIRE